MSSGELQPAADGGRRLSRRRLLALLGAGALAACTGRASSPVPTASPGPRPTPTPTPIPPPTPTPIPSPTPTPTPTPTPDSPILPTPVAWEPGDDEVYPNAKVVAARVVEDLLTHPVGSRAEELVVATDVPTTDLDHGATADALRPAVDTERQSLGIVVYPQLGGLHPAPESGRTVRHCSVMVVVDQFLSVPDPQEASDVERLRRTIDVRLEVVAGEWRWRGLGDAGGEPVERPEDLSDAAVAVLDDDRIDLPDSAQWDIHRGFVDEELLEVMVVMAEQVPYRVTALRSGHPRRVFGRRSVSNHYFGRAVDVWSIGDDPVVLQRPAVRGFEPARQTPAHRLTEALLDRTSVSELGSPWDLDGPVSADRPSTRSFTNTVHADHLHIAFEDPVPGAPSDAPPG